MGKHDFDDGLPNWLLYIIEIILIIFLLFSILGEFSNRGTSYCKDFSGGCFTPHLFEDAQPALVFFNGVFASLLVIPLILFLFNLKKYPKNTLTLSILSGVNWMVLINFVTTKNYTIYNIDKVIFILITIVIMTVAWKLRKK